MGSHIACTKLCRIPILLVRREGGGGVGHPHGAGSQSPPRVLVSATPTGLGLSHPHGPGT